ncbi:hypothetical protein [Nocardia mexicana]|uniref:Uncharacterized protein n=1 Tax=Nocardia mexicana TaxID=279262 RepID=A0A370HGK4_9NOCA|nr:hypothetical protein [Nocardia mexicana]RDI55916.1 hypothetical protein DFR68_101753 [Nocardia mexicana]
MDGEIVLAHPDVEIIAASDVPQLMQQILPQWQAKGLIDRVRRLLPVDPSSACQRLLNAAIADLREKITIAGLDIAGEAAAAHKLPPVKSSDDIESYSTAKIIDLSYRMGLLSRAEWRRLTRTYDIRRDLEHEDSEYEAGIEDCIYIFKTCIEAVLSKDPVTLLKVIEVKDLIQASVPATADARLVEDYSHAPDTRQIEILEFLTSYALDEKNPEIVRQNSYSVLSALAETTRDSVRVGLATKFQERVGREPLTKTHVRVADAAGVLPYLRRAQRSSFFASYNQLLETTGYDFRSNARHGALLRDLIECGGLHSIPPDELIRTLKWLVLCYIGEPGGYGAGIHRRVFYSNSGAPLAMALIERDVDIAREPLAALANDNEVEEALRNEHVARRYQDLLDLVEP